MSGRTRKPFAGISKKILGKCPGIDSGVIWLGIDERCFGGISEVPPEK